MPAPREPDIADDVREWLMDRLPSAGVSGATAQALVTDLEHWLRQQYGTGRHYVRAPHRAPTRSAILADWRSGRTVRDIAGRYGVTVQYVYRVINDKRPSLGREDWEERG